MGRLIRGVTGCKKLTAFDSGLRIKKLVSDPEIVKARKEERQVRSKIHMLYKQSKAGLITHYDYLKKVRDVLEQHNHPQK